MTALLKLLLPLLALAAPKIQDADVKANAGIQLSKIATPATTKGDTLASTGTALARQPAPAAGEVLIGNPATATGLESSALGSADLTRAAFSATVASGTITITLTALDGSALSASNPAKIAFRSNTATDGSQTVRSGNPSALTIPMGTGASLGLSGSAGTFYVYANWNSLTGINLAVSASQLSERLLPTTYAMSSSSTDPTLLYGNGSGPIRLLGSVTVTNTAGTIAVTNVASFTTRSTAAAQINVGKTFMGSVTLSNCSGQWDYSGAAYVDTASAPTCTKTNNFPTMSSVVPLPGTAPGFTLNGRRGIYEIEAIGLMGGAGLAQFRFSDGTVNSKGDNAAQVVGASTIFVPTIRAVMDYSGTAPSNALVRIMARNDSASTTSIYANSPRSITFNVWRVDSDSILAGAIITTNPRTSLASLLTTRVTVPPTKLGEYRAYTRNANARTFADAAPATAPNANDGIPLYQGSPYASADTNVVRWEFYIGDKFYDLRGYTAAGRNGGFSLKASPGTYEIGQVDGYNPATGILTVTRSLFGTGNAYIGMNTSNGDAVVGNGYFDVFLFDNPLGAGITPTEDYWIGRGEVRAPGSSMYYTSSISKGGGFSCVCNSTVGTECTLLSEGQVQVRIESDAGGIGNYFGVTTIPSSGSGGGSGAIERILCREVFKQANGYVQGCTSIARRFPRGTIFKPFNNLGSNGSNSADAQFYISRLPDPLETAGAAGGGNVSTSGGAEFVDRLSVNAPCTTTPCPVTSIRQSGNWVSSIVRRSIGNYQVLFAKPYSAAPTCFVTSKRDNSVCAIQQNNGGGGDGDELVSEFSFMCRFNDTSATNDSPFSIHCQGPR